MEMHQTSHNMVHSLLHYKLINVFKSYKRMYVQCSVTVRILSRLLFCRNCLPDSSLEIEEEEDVYSRCWGNDPVYIME